MSAAVGLELVGCDAVGAGVGVAAGEVVVSERMVCVFSAGVVLLGAEAVGCDVVVGEGPPHPAVTLAITAANRATRRAGMRILSETNLHYDGDACAVVTPGRSRGVSAAECSSTSPAGPMSRHRPRRTRRSSWRGAVIEQDAESRSGWMRTAPLKGRGAVR